MSSAQFTVVAAPASVGDWTELATRGSNEFEISLVWSKATGRVRVCVLDDLLGESFDLDVAGADALSAFYHPFAYAAGRGLLSATDTPVSLDLQPQS